MKTLEVQNCGNMQNKLKIDDFKKSDVLQISPSRKLGSYYQNVQVSGGKWHMSHLISCPIAWEIDSKLFSVQLDHPVSKLN